MTSSYSLSQGTGLRPAWLFGSFRMCLFHIFYETSLCLFFSLRVSIPLLQVITSSSKLIPGQSSIELQKHVIPAMERLIEWLPLHFPESQKTTVAHGNFRYCPLGFLGSRLLPSPGGQAVRRLYYI